MALSTDTIQPAPQDDAPLAIDEGGFLTPQRIKVIGIALAVVLVVAAGVWFAITAGKRKEAFAAKALEDARLVAEQGNLPEAVSQFEKVIVSYKGTSAAYSAALGVAQARLVSGQTELAISSLTEFLKGNPPALYAAPAYGLLGTAHENTGKHAEAAADYRRSADAATDDYLKATALLDAGRAYRNAKNREEAIKSYQEILDKYGETAARTEAEVRLAELTGGQG
jgi:tetratricopeptide (TPR) repeat protein